MALTMRTASRWIEDNVTEEDGADAVLSAMIDAGVAEDTDADYEMVDTVIARRRGGGRKQSRGKRLRKQREYNKKNKRRIQQSRKRLQRGQRKKRYKKRRDRFGSKEKEVVAKQSRGQRLQRMRKYNKLKKRDLAKTRKKLDRGQRTRRFKKRRQRAASVPMRIAAIAERIAAPYPEDRDQGQKDFDAMKAIVRNLFEQNKKHDFDVKILPRTGSFIITGDVDLILKIIRELIGESTKVFGTHGYVVEVKRNIGKVLLKNYSLYTDKKWGEIWK